MNEPKTLQATEVTTADVDTLMSKLGDTEVQSALKDFITTVGKKGAVYKVNPATVDQCISDIDAIISAQMDAILHDKDFKALEASWRGLQTLVQGATFERPVRFALLDISKEELSGDFEGAEEGIETSEFYKKIYQRYNLAGGHPYTAIISDYQFSNSAADIKLLTHMATMGELVQVPFIGNAQPEFFGHTNFNEVIDDRHLKERMKEDDEYILWNNFRDDDRSKYVGLAMPRFLGRLSYGQGNDETTKSFNYTEGAKKDSDYLWCNASFALAKNIIKSFEKWGWSTKVVGTDSGGRVENLPMPTYDDGGQKKAKIPIEVALGMDNEKILCELGFIPLVHWDRSNYAVFFELPSAQRPKVIKDNAEATRDYAVGARLQYVMLVTRIAHYLKYRQLKFVGKNAGAGEIKADLQKWLDTLVSDVPTADEETAARYPLRSCEVEVKESEDKPGFFHVSVTLRPHVSIVGMEVNLRLAAYQEKPKE